jgi:hypothetical protein
MKDVMSFLNRCCSPFSASALRETLFDAVQADDERTLDRMCPK